MAEEDSDKPETNTLTKIFTKKIKTSLQLTEDCFKESLVKFIVTSNQPFTLVEEEDFRNLISLISKNEDVTRIPCAKTIKSWVRDMYERELARLKEKLASNSSKISFSIDCWTSSNQIPFQGVVGSWIDGDWKLRYCVLDLTILEGSHTGENIADAFIKVLTEFNLLSKLHAVISDNASNVNKACDVIETLLKDTDNPFVANQSRIRCFAHILNLVCKSILKRESESQQETREMCETKFDEHKTIQKLRKCVHGIRASPQRRQIFARHVKL